MLNDNQWETDHAKLIRGDCFAILPTLKEESIDMIFVDPPYNLSNYRFTCQSGRVASVYRG